MEKVLFALVFFVAYTIQAITGFAGNIFAMPAGTALIGLHSSVAVLNVMGLFACGLLAVTNIGCVNRRELARIVLTMLPFVALGIWIDSVLPLPVLLRVYGVVIVLVGVKNLLSTRQGFLPEWALWAVLALAGLIQGMFVSGGALLVVYAVQKLTDRDEFRITLSMVWTILNLVYTLFSVSQGYFTADVVGEVVLCIPVAVAATWLGNRLQAHIGQKWFMRLVYALLICIGAALVATS